MNKKSQEFQEKILILIYFVIFLVDEMQTKQGIQHFWIPGFGKFFLFVQHKLE